MDIDKAIGALEYCRAMILFDPDTGDTHSIEQENAENQDLYHACGVAIEVLKQKETCTWRCIDGQANLWECSACGAVWRLDVDNPIENNMKFCPECGRKLE